MRHRLKNPTKRRSKSLIKSRKPTKKSFKSAKPAIEFFLCRPTHNPDLERGFHVKNRSITQFEIAFNYTNSNPDEAMPDISEQYGGFCYNMADKRNASFVAINILSKSGGLDYEKVYCGFKSVFTPNVKEFNGKLGKLLEPDIKIIGGGSIDRIDSRSGSGNRIDRRSGSSNRIDNIYRAIYLARLLINLPPNIKTFDLIGKLINEYKNTYLKRANTSSAVNGLKIETIPFNKLGSDSLIRAFGSNSSKGNQKDGGLLILEYNGKKVGDCEPIIFVGKGVLFDSGGYDLKSVEDMAEMKTDMAGMAVCLGIILSVVELQIPVNIKVVCPVVTNLIGENTILPTSVYNSLSGKKVEVIDTDAEGRLILGDAIAYCCNRWGDTCNTIIDIATLTGQQDDLGGKMFANALYNKPGKYVFDRLKSASMANNEPIYELPLMEEYSYLLESDVADYKNVTDEWNSDIIVGGLFIKKMIPEKCKNVKWIHIDIAGVANNINDVKDYYPAGGSGFGIRTFLDFLEHF